MLSGDEVYGDDVTSGIVPDDEIQTEPLWRTHWRKLCAIHAELMLGTKAPYKFGIVSRGGICRGKTNDDTITRALASLHSGEVVTFAMVQELKTAAEAAKENPMAKTTKASKAPKATDLCTFAVRLAKADRKKIHDAAEKAGVSATAWAIKTLVDNA